VDYNKNPRLPDEVSVGAVVEHPGGEWMARGRKTFASPRSELI